MGIGRPFLGMQVASRVSRLLRQQDTLGHDVIDSEHRAIGDWWQRTIRCEPVEFAFFLARLKKLMGMHFDHEAMLMQAAGGRMCECHYEEHRVLLALCEEAGVLSLGHWRKAQSLLRRDLPRLIREHIIAMDQLVVLFINTQGEIGGASGANCHMH